MLRAAGSALLAATAATITFGVVSASTNSSALDEAATAQRPAARLVVPDAAPVVTTAPPATTPAPDPVPDDEGGQVIALLNAERLARGLAPLAVNSRVTASAVAHSADQAAHRHMSHTGSDGSNTGDRLERAGFDWWTWGENVGAGYPDAEAMFRGWMNSTGHRLNMLSTNFEYVGVAMVRASDGTPYWTMVLAR